MTRRLRPRTAASASAKAALALATALALTGCSTSTGGTATPPPNLSTSTTASATATTTTAQAAPTQPGSEVPPQYKALAERVNEIVADNSTFWARHGEIVPRSGYVVAQITDGPCPKTDTTTPAWACADEKVITVNAPEMAEVQRVVGDLGIAVVIGHEAGHIAMPQIDPALDTGGNLEERRADCMAGAYVRWIADGNSTTFSTPTQADLDTARRQMMNKQPRKDAYDHGWSSGALSCTTYQP